MIKKKSNQNIPEIHINKKNNKITNKGQKNYLPFKKLEQIIRVSGILNKLPGNSDSFIIINLIIGILIGIIINKLFSLKIIGIIIPFIYYLLIYIILLSYKKANIENMYKQLELFIKKCCDGKYFDITEYVGTIYQDFEGNFRDNLQNCYIEAKQTGNKEKAINTLKSKYDVDYLSFCIDTLQMIKNSEKTDRLDLSTEYIYNQTKSKINTDIATENYLLSVKIDMCINLICCIFITILISLIFKTSLLLFIKNKICIILGILFIILFIRGLCLTNK